MSSFVLLLKVVDKQDKRGMERDLAASMDYLCAFLRPFHQLPDVVVNSAYSLIGYAFGVPVLKQEVSYRLKLFHVRFLSPVHLEQYILYHFVYDRKYLALFSVKEGFVPREFFLKSFVSLFHDSAVLAILRYL